MSLSILFGIINTISNFLLTYTFFSSKYAKAFKFVNTYCKKLFF